MQIFDLMRQMSWVAAVAGDDDLESSPPDTVTA